MFAKKSLGQNFLHDESALRAIVEAGDVQAGDHILEIGPGLGALTKKLLATGARIVAIEKDDRLIAILNETFKVEIENKTFTLIHGDALEVDIKKLGFKNNAYKLIANIPYYITGQILRQFTENTPRPTCAVMMVQKEVAERAVARDGKESILSMSIKAFGDPKKIKTVPRGAFNPAPGVDSAILLIKDIYPRFEKQEEQELFFLLMKAGFAAKRKMLAPNLREVTTNPHTLLVNAGLSEKVRAEDLHLEDWKKIIYYAAGK
jgi:16S rRNA (adenine1518-N6/adenine1519-N6)-dimethyltransferase